MMSMNNTQTLSNSRQNPNVSIFANRRNNINTSLGSNLALNAKGVTAFKSSGQSLLDFFVRSSKQPVMTIEEFTMLFTEIHSAFSTNPKAFIKLLNFQRNIKGGNGIKMYLWLGLLLLKNSASSELYKSILGWTYQYSKDLHQLSRFTSSVNIGGQEELDLYASKVYEQLIKLLSGNTKDLDLMLFKYLSHAHGHWSNETDQIWLRVNTLLCSSALEVDQLLKSDQPLPNQNNLGVVLRSLLVKQVGQKVYITPRLKRKIKVAVNSRLHLTDYLLAGIHYDETYFNFSPDLVDTESTKIANEISQSAAIATKKLCQSIQKWKKGTSTNSTHMDQSVSVIEQITVPELTQIQKLLMSGHDKYLELLKLKAVVAKEVGVDLNDLVYNYFTCGTDTTGLESQINERIDRIRKQVMPMFTDTFTLLDFVKSFRIIMDRSGSMEGAPLKSGLFQMLIMAKIFRVKQIIYFDCDVEVKHLTDSDLNGPILNLVKKVYTRHQGSTNLEKAMDYLENSGASNKNVIIITDSDCDPNSFGYQSSPFHTAFDDSKYKHLPTNRYIVMNVKETKMSFPYLDFHQNVSYISGVSCLDFLIQALVRSSRDKEPLTPQLVLDCCLDADRFKIPDHINDLLSLPDSIQLKPLENYNLDDLFQKWNELIPKKKEVEITDNHDDNESDDEESYQSNGW
jgi:hypothetical protein